MEKSPFIRSYGLPLLARCLHLIHLSHHNNKIKQEECHHFRLLQWRHHVPAGQRPCCTVSLQMARVQHSVEATLARILAGCRFGLVVLVEGSCNTAT